MDRLSLICAHIPACRVFADIGCDHGYCTAYVLEKGLCERAYVSDISAACLKKAETLLAAEIAAGRCVPVCADGLDGVQDADCVLIAGMGGEEIVRILSRAPLPEHFILQPMHNVEKVRRHLLARGAHIEEDFTFEDGKFYDLIVGSAAGGDAYSDFEYRYGRDNLKAPSAAFLRKVRKDADVLREALAAGVRGEQREALREKLHELEAISDAIEERL